MLLKKRSYVTLHCEHGSCALQQHVCMYVCLLSWGPTEGQQTKFCLCQFIQSKISLLRETQLLMNPPHAFASQLSKKVGYWTKILKKTGMTSSNGAISSLHCSPTDHVTIFRWTHVKRGFPFEMTDLELLYHVRAHVAPSVSCSGSSKGSHKLPVMA